MTEQDQSLMIDYQMYLTKKNYQSIKKSNKYNDIVYAVSDVKEGYHKDFFDGLRLFDFHLPFVRIYYNLIMNFS